MTYLPFKTDQEGRIINSAYSEVAASNRTEEATKEKDSDPNHERKLWKEIGKIKF